MKIEEHLVAGGCELLLLVRCKLKMKMKMIDRSTTNLTSMFTFVKINNYKQYI